MKCKEYVSIKNNDDSNIHLSLWENKNDMKSWKFYVKKQKGPFSEE